jgi:hypothetical protein
MVSAFSIDRFHKASFSDKQPISNKPTSEIKNTGACALVFENTYMDTTTINGFVN